MHAAARARLVLARRPWLYWAAVLLLAGATATVLAAAGGAIDDARRAWGETRRVIVATADLAPGDPLAGATEQRDLPRADDPRGGPGDRRRERCRPPAHRRR